MATAAEQLAAHFVRLRLDAIPRKHVDDVKVLVRDYLGVALGGSRTDSGRIAATFAEQTGGTAEAVLIGHGGRVPAVHAAFANAIASHSIELDDVDILALFHFSPPVISAALATAERVGRAARAFLTAAVAGCEMMARVSDATNPSLRNRAYHTTPTAGVFGAAIAAAHLLGLDEAQTVSALGMAGAQASGLMEMYGPSMQKRFNPGPAARNGVTAAVMAQLGFTGAATILDGERGFCRAFSDTYDVGKLTQGLGSDFPIFIEYKAYSCARPIHNAIDCALAGAPATERAGRSHSQHDHAPSSGLGALSPEQDAADLSRGAGQPALLGGRGADRGRGAAAAVPGREAARAGDPAPVGDVAIEVDPSLPRGVSCYLTVETAGGVRLTAQVDHPRGSIANPMTPEEMSRKVHMLADPVLGKAGVARVIEATEGMETLASIGALTGLLAAV